MSEGKPIQCRAAVAWKANEPVTVQDIIVAPPKAGEVRVKVVANALCHTDVYTLDGNDPEGRFLSILGHEAAGIVESVGEGVTSVAPGDHIIPLFTPQCKESDCIFCMSPKTNLCPKLRITQGQGKMPDGTTRFSTLDGQPIHHYMGTSTFSEYTVVAEISCAKIDSSAPLDTVCLFGCGVTTGLGAAWRTCDIDEGASVAVFGLGAVGLSVIQAAKARNARRIFAIDIRPSKFDMARKLGATDFLNPLDYPERPIQSVIVEMTTWGVDYTFDATGDVDVMRAALESAHRGWGQSCIIGVAAAGKLIQTRPFMLVTGRRWLGTAFRGFKSRDDVLKLVSQYVRGELPIEDFITHRLKGVDKVDEAIGILRSGDCLRAVVTYAND